MRINKFLASCGVDSRRNCEEYVKNGKVKINGITITDLSAQVEPGDEVTLLGKKIELENELVYYMLNKPDGYVCAVKPTRNEPTVVSLIDTDKRIFPVGRLDKNTRGLIILTNDGILANRLTHPKYEKEKTYYVLIAGILNNYEAEKLRKGVLIEGTFTAPALVEKIKRQGNNTSFEITIHEGRNRQIRKMCESVGHRVLFLERVSCDGLKLGNLRVGEYRVLTSNEIKLLLK